MTASVSAELLSELIDGIYACALDPGAWPAALRRINEATACHASVVGIVSFEEDYSLVNATAGFDEGFAQRYGTNLPALSEIWGGDHQVAARPMHQPVVLSLHHPDALIRGSAKHNLLCEVLGFDVEDTLNLPLAHFGRAVGAAGFARRRGEGPFERALYDVYRLLSPHIQRSADINRLLDARAVSVALRDGLLELLRAPVAIVDRRMTLVYANGLARPLLAGRRPGRMEPGEACLLPPRLRQAVAEVTSGKSSYHCVASAGVTGDGSQIVHVMALREEGRSSDHAALVFTPARSVDPAAVASIAAQYALTEAETAVLSHLIQGDSTSAIARALGLRPSTVRTHSLRIYEKFEVHRRAELVARFTAIAGPFDPTVHQMVDAP